jgi:hypothetical protein
MPDEHAGFDILALSSLGKIGGRDKGDAPVHNHAFGVKTCSLLGVFGERAWIVKHFGQ